MYARWTDAGSTSILQAPGSRKQLPGQNDSSQEMCCKRYTRGQGRKDRGQAGHQSKAYSPKVKQQVHLLKDPRDSALRCSIGSVTDDVISSEFRIKNNCTHRTETKNAECFDLYNTDSGLLNTFFEPTYSNMPANSTEDSSSLMSAVLPVCSKCGQTNCENIPATLSTRMGDTSRFSELSRNYKSSYQRQSLCLIGLILLLIDVSIIPAIIVRSIPVPISITVRFAFGLLMFNNSLVNPWVYALQSKDFRTALKDNIRKIRGITCLSYDG